MTKDQEDELLFAAITESGSHVLEDILMDYQRDINEKIYTVEDGDTDMILSPFEMTITCHKPEIMSLIIESKNPGIDMNTFSFVFKSSCVECFDVLLDHSRNLLSWNFNREILEKIVEFSVDNSHFITITSKFVKRLDFNDKLALIENVFNSCSDHEKIDFAVDSVLLDVAYREMRNEYLEKDERTAVIAFTQ